MIKAIIVDDEPLAISVIKDYLADHQDITVIAECRNGFEAMKAINSEKPDLLFLDIQMPKISGLELLEVLDPAPPVIFITAFHEHAVEAFEKHAVDYLLKPVSKERFNAALARFRKQQISISSDEVSSLRRESKDEMEKIVVRDGSNLRIISLEDVCYFEAYDDYVKINLAKETILKKQTMNSLEEMLDPHEFLRVHRSFIVKLSSIIRIEPLGKDTYIAILTNGSKVNLSRTGYSRLKEKLKI